MAGSLQKKAGMVELSGMHAAWGDQLWEQAWYSHIYDQCLVLEWKFVWRGQETDRLAEADTHSGNTA